MFSHFASIADIFKSKVMKANVYLKDYSSTQSISRLNSNPTRHVPQEATYVRISSNDATSVDFEYHADLGDNSMKLSPSLLDTGTIGVLYWVSSFSLYNAMGHILLSRNSKIMKSAFDDFDRFIEHAFCPVMRVSNHSQGMYK
jgi:hypothetical protein